MFIVLDEQGRVKGWSKEAEELTFFLRREVMGLQFLELLTQPYRDAASQMIQQTKSGGSVQPFQALFYTKAGEKLDIMFIAHNSLADVVVEGRRLVSHCDAELIANMPSKVSQRRLDTSKASVLTCETCDTLTSHLIAT
eukprot:TRINITY_DN59317_c0_g1_i1.p1 TRINITY_DN59317_c0_g1~~TRINITY_DN59317_c0_g1_i1.p1  ORF type:complete len:153 (-),score=27.80 TRINITY_DN59317_c0_g1_i1:309-725(-)